MRLALRFAFLAAFTFPLFATTPRISFERLVPAPHDLGKARELSVIYALGDSDKLALFLDVLTAEDERAELVISNSTRHKQHFITSTPSADTIAELRKLHPADAYLGVKAFTCRATTHEGEGSEHDVDGKRVKNRVYWSDAVCEARIDVLDGHTVRKLFSYRITGEGKSSRTTQLTDEAQAAALEQAARRTAIDALENIMPRRIRESIALDDTAPLFDEGFAMIDASRIEEARLTWERGLRQYASSAALHYNLAAACDALGDVAAARQHYEEAQRLAPDELRYRTALEAFRRRSR